MKHNGVVTRILKTSSAASGQSAGGASKARPAPTPASPAKDDDVDSIVAAIDGDLSKEAERAPVFAANMEREIAAILARGGVKTRTPTADAPTPPEKAPEPAPAPRIQAAAPANPPAPPRPAPQAKPAAQATTTGTVAAVVATPAVSPVAANIATSVSAAAATSISEADRVTVRAPGHSPESEPTGQVPAPPRPPPLPNDLHNAVTARPPQKAPPPLPKPPPPPQAAPNAAPPVKRPFLAAAKPPEPVRVHVKPPPVPLALAPRRETPVHVEVIDPPAETRREPGAQRPNAPGGRKSPPPVEYWADMSLVESVPPSDAADSPSGLVSSGSDLRPSYPRGFTGQAIVLYQAAREGELLPDRPALFGPPPLPPAAITTQAGRPSMVRGPLNTAERTPIAVQVPATAWVQQPARSASTKRPVRARLQAAALGIAAGVAISMVLTWRPDKAPPPPPVVAGAEMNAAMMAPPRAPDRAVPPAQAASAEPAATLAPSNKPPEATTAAPKGSARPSKPSSKPTAQAKAPAPQAREPEKAMTQKLSGRVAGDDE